MASDAAANKPRSRDEYLKILREAGHKSASSAGFILAREAKRAFGCPLGRGRRGPPPGRSKGGRQPNNATILLREKLQQDKANGGLRDAAHYIRWLVDKANVGIKRARPVVYRELRAAR